MKTSSIAIVALALTACATGPSYDMNSADFKRCEYEAQLATPRTNSIVADAMRKADLADKCMRLKGH